jgi:hypothetical protein
MVDGASEEVDNPGWKDNEDESRVAWVVSALVAVGKMNRLKLENKSKQDDDKFWHLFNS